MTQAPVQNQLYDRDFYLWITDTVSKLKAREFYRIDLENLIEEIEALGRREKRELESRLRVLLSHLIKRSYILSPDDFRGWETTIRNQRSELQILLEQSPSLKPYFLEVFDRSWQYTLAEIGEEYPSIQLPDDCPFPLDIKAILSQRFWENN